MEPAGMAGAEVLVPQLQALGTRVAAAVLAEVAALEMGEEVEVLAAATEAALPKVAVALVLGLLFSCDKELCSMSPMARFQEAQWREALQGMWAALSAKRFF
ncbi:MAG: hypothetical protein K8T25_07955 [Planctomycetia bacterium]|nr:hypothetical protein [Planctomycetia bacterium]